MAIRYRPAPWWRRLAVLAAFTFAASATPALAQVVLNPAEINGTISLTGYTLNNVYVSASWTDTSTNPPTNYSAGTSVNGDSYTLIVNVPAGSQPTYTVYASGYISGTNQNFSFPPQTVEPVFGTPKTVDFSLNPGLIQGTVTAVGGTLNYFYVFAGSSYSSFSGSVGTYSLVVVPGTSIYTYSFGGGQFGGAQVTPSYYYVDVSAGGTTSGVDWTFTVPAAPPTGAIEGTIAFPGNSTPTSLYVAASGPSYASTATSGAFSFPDLYAGSYNMYGSASFANGSYFSFPDGMFSPSRNLTVSGGATSIVNISGVQNYLNGAITLGGTNTLADTSSASFNVSGIYQTPSYGGSAGSSLPANGAYSLVLSDGSWYHSNLYLTFYKPDDPANYLYEYLYFYDYQRYANPIMLSGGQTVTDNLTYATGKITVNFQALGNATFSNPNLSVSCSDVDPLTQQTKWYYNAYAYNQSLIDVTEGGVTFVGMAGACQIQASAYVNGTNYVTFGNLNVTLVPGAIQVIDIGGPSLVVSSPDAGSITNSPSITVTGTADDEVVDIDTITVNGVAATFSSTGNGARPHQVSFSTSVPLSLGANTIATVVTALPTDVPAKSASDTRTVFYQVTPTITAAGGTFTYSGSPHAGSGSATGGHGQSLAVTLTYSGTGSTSYGPTASAPTSVGTYQVVAHTDGDADTLSGDSAPAALIIIEAESGSLDVCGVDMPNGPKKSGSTIPIKVQVCDGSGASVSSVVVHATGIQLVSGTQNGTLQDSGNANPGMNFRVVGPPSSYMFNLQTTGFKTGTYNLLFTIGSDPTVHAVSFQIK